MNRAEYRIALADDRSTVRIETVIDNEVKAWSETSSEELSGIIEIFGAFRAAMVDEIPKELDPGSRVPRTVDPIWRSIHTPEEKSVDLALRHPGFGWLQFSLPESSWISLRDWLVAPR